MKVRATKRGYYGELLRRAGDVFEIVDAGHFSARWMEKVDADTPERRASAQQAIDDARASMSSLGETRRVAWPVSDDEDAGGVRASVNGDS